MATDLTEELKKNNLANPKPTLPVDLGLAAAGSYGVDRYQDRRSSCAGLPSSSTLTCSKEGGGSQCATSGRISEYHAPVFDIFKKIRRAERFGIPVHLSEAEKRHSRAERFGIGLACGPDAMLKAEELKRKARAERFELLTLSVTTDEESKKKARLARFAPFS